MFSSVILFLARIHEYSKIIMVGLKRFCFSGLFCRHTKTLLQKLQLQPLLFRSVYLKTRQALL